MVLTCVNLIASQRNAVEYSPGNSHVPPAIDPNADGVMLQNLANTQPELWDAIVVHPNAYPALIAWIESQRTPTPPVDEPGEQSTSQPYAQAAERPVFQGQWQPQSPAQPQHPTQPSPWAQASAQPQPQNQPAGSAQLAPQSQPYSQFQTRAQTPPQEANTPPLWLTVGILVSSVIGLVAIFVPFMGYMGFTLPYIGSGRASYTALIVLLLAAGGAMASFFVPHQRVRAIMETGALLAAINLTFVVVVNFFEARSEFAGMISVGEVLAVGFYLCIVAALLLFGFSIAGFVVHRNQNRPAPIPQA